MNEQNTSNDNKQFISYDSKIFFKWWLQQKYFWFLEMFSSDTYMELFRELVKIHSEPGPFNKPWCNVPMAKFHKLQDAEIKTEEDESRYSRAYVSELASQFREEEMIVGVNLKGAGIHFQVLISPTF